MLFIKTTMFPCRTVFFALGLIVGCEQDSIAKESLPIQQAAPVQKIESTSMSKISNLFTIKVFKKMAVNNQEKNLVVSPESILSVSAMMWLGASHDTKKQLTQALFSYSNLNIVLNDHHLCEAMKQFLTRRSSSQGIIEMQANGLWLQKDFQIKHRYVQQLKHCFNTELHTMNVSKPMIAVKDINAWVKSNTQGMISHLLKVNDISKNTKLLLLDTLYFKGNWSQPFKKENNQKLPFYNKENSDSAHKITMMTDKSVNYQYIDNTQWQILSKDYVDGNAALIIFLPKQGQFLSELLQNVKEKDFLKLINSLTVLPVNTLIDLHLPKYTISTTSSLIPLFKQLGVVDLFSPTKANLSNIVKIQQNRRLYVNLFLQKALVQVNEQGTKAAAATVVGINTTAIRIISPPKVIKFYSNRPFLYMIYDKQRQTILFIGQYVTPNNKLLH